MADKNLSKAQEIELLEKLANGGGYFAEQFGKDVPQMVANIRNDFTIKFSTSIEELESKVRLRDGEVKHLLEELYGTRRQIAENDEQIGGLLNFKEELLIKAVQIDNREMLEMFDIREVLKMKLRMLSSNGFESSNTLNLFSKNEVEYLMKAV